MGWLAVAAMAAAGALFSGANHGWSPASLGYGALAGLAVFGLPLLLVALIFAWLRRH
ncbi:MAG: hypothetical protein ACN6N0_16855 [Microvirgula sp.]